MVSEMIDWQFFRGRKEKLLRVQGHDKIQLHVTKSRSSMEKLNP
jgi:hypothetical protein